MNCVDCDRPLRPKGTRITDHPGTVQQEARGLCRGCYAKHPPTYKRDNRRSTPECVKCDRPFRPSHTKLSDFPGTVAMRKDGLCKSCWNYTNGHTPVQRKRRPPQCQGCERPMRPKLRTDREFPGTVEHGGLGLCTTCYPRAYRGEVAKPATLSPAAVAQMHQDAGPEAVTVEPEAEPVEDTGLTVMLEERRRRRTEAERRAAAFQRAEAIRQRFLAHKRKTAA